MEDETELRRCEPEPETELRRCEEETELRIIFNQFAEFGNTVAHYYCTGSALQNVFEDLNKKNGNKLQAR